MKLPAALAAGLIGLALYCPQHQAPEAKKPAAAQLRSQQVGKSEARPQADLRRFLDEGGQAFDPSYVPTYSHADQPE
jgi:hypothetical protein